jgi:hypothetical protein
VQEKPVIFISYSHEDRRWLKFVQGHLQVAVSNDHFKTWDDQRIEGGADWKAEIDAALSTCAAFVLLVSRHSLVSRFILNNEVKAALEAHWERGVRIYPIIVTACDVHAVPWLTRMNIRPADARPLALFPSARRDETMAALAAEIRGIVTAASASAANASRSKQVIDYGRLPETAYKRLVGREREFEQLDDAWEDRATNIVSLVSEGGVGKSALVNEWLVHLREEDYRGADAILGWSFFSQGSQQQATSGEPFLNWALEALEIQMDVTVAASATAKAEKLAAFMTKRRVLLILDGLESLQHGPGLQAGQLKDHGLRAFLMRLATTPPASGRGLVLITSRIAIRDIDRWKNSGAKVIDLGRLSEEAGIALLRTNGVKRGSSRDFREAVRAFAGHALSLNLLASLLIELHDGDVRRRDRIREILHDTDVPGHAEARRVVAAYEEQWLVDKPGLLAIMHIVGLFDRPVSIACLRALRDPPAIAGLTDRMIDIDNDDWKHSVARLREVRLLSPSDPNSPDTLDAHPLVREWFGERLKEKNESAWREAHGRIYEHLRNTTDEGETPSLEALAPLYQAIIHGCHAGRHQDALSEIFKKRIMQLSAQPSEIDIKYYALDRLGAVDSNIAALSWFCITPFTEPSPTLSEYDQAWVLNESAFYLRLHGRLSEAQTAARHGLDRFKKLEEWRKASNSASTLCRVELLLGNIASAIRSAKLGIEFAQRSENAFMEVSAGTSLADAEHAAGNITEADRQFILTDLTKEKNRHRPFRAYWQYRYHDFLLGVQKWHMAYDRARTYASWTQREMGLLDVALRDLVLGRGALGVALSSRGQKKMAVLQERLKVSRFHLEKIVDVLSAAGRVDYDPCGYLARAAYRRSIGDWRGAARDLDEVEEIAEPGPMRLFLCDMALERVRLAFAQIEAFAPLNGLLENDNPPKPTRPRAGEVAKLKVEASKQITIANEYIQTCGYHRRDGELTELQAVLRGERTFASLPPRV